MRQLTVNIERVDMEASSKQAESTAVVKEEFADAVEDHASPRKISVTSDSEGLLTVESATEGSLAEGQEVAAVSNKKSEEVTGGEGKKKALKKEAVIQRPIPQFEPALFSTPDLMQKVGEANSSHSVMVRGSAKAVKAQKILVLKKEFKKDDSEALKGEGEGEGEGSESVLCKEEKVSSSEKDDKTSEDSVIRDQSDELEGGEVPKMLTDTLNSDPSVDSAGDKRVGDNRPKIIQVKSPKGIRQVVVLNSAKAGMYREPLIKVIPPKDPPREEEKISPGKQRASQKKEKVHKKEGDPQKSANDKCENGGLKAAGKIEAQLKSADPFKRLEDVGLMKKKEESQRKIEEIQKKREELMKKREAIIKRKEVALQQKLDEQNGKLETTPVRNNVASPRKNIQQKKEPLPEKKPTKQLVKTPSRNAPTPARKTILPAEDSTVDESPLRRSGRAIKKKTFGDEMLTFDLKEDIATGDAPEEEQEQEQEQESEDDEVSLSFWF